MNMPAGSVQPPPSGPWSDSPIRDKSADHFGYGDFAQMLARLAADADTPLTIGIFGKWGTGKTSLLSLLHERLTDQEFRHRPTFVLWINAWQLDFESHLGIAFLQALLVELRRSLPLHRRILFSYFVWRQRFSFLGLIRQVFLNSIRIAIAAIPILLGTLLVAQPPAALQSILGTIRETYAAQIASAILALWLVVKPLLEEAQGAMSVDLSQVMKSSTLEARVGTLTLLRKHFAGIVSGAIGSHGRVIVLVDDLDRCTPESIPPLLEALSLFADIKSTVYVLALDEEAAKSAIARHLGSEPHEAEGFLHKIFQVPFALPPLDPGRISRYIHLAYPDVVLLSPSASVIFAQSLEPNPRILKRALNRFRSLMEVAKARSLVWEVEDIHPELVAKLVALESRLPGLYRDVMKSPPHLLTLESLARPALRGPTPPKTKNRRTPPSKPDLSQHGLSAADLPILRTIFAAGDTSFAVEAPQPHQIAAYFHLISPSPDLLVYASPERETQADLLSGSQERIEAAVRRVLEVANHTAEPSNLINTYSRRLRSVLDTPQDRSPVEVASANFAMALFEADSTGDALKAAQTAVQRRPTDPLSRRMLAKLYLDANRYVEADDQTKHALALEARIFPGSARTVSSQAGRSRPLSPSELAEARRVFSDGLDYSQVRIVETAGWTNTFSRLSARLRGAPPPAFDNAVALGQTIYFPRPLRTSPEDLHQSGVNDMPWLVHELVHVWQAQRQGSARNLIATLKSHSVMGPRVYDYGGKSALEKGKAKRKSIWDFNPEQQGELAREFYHRIARNQDTSPWDYFVRQFAKPG